MSMKGKHGGSDDLAGQIMKKAGLKEEEIRRTTEITAIDAAAAALYKGELGKSPASPVHKLTWRTALLSEFAHVEPDFDPEYSRVMADSLAALHANKAAGAQFDPETGKVSDKSMTDLGKSGWWGLRVPREFGGIDAATVNAMRGITQMSAAGFANEAGLQSVHGCIGAVGPLRLFGSDAVKNKILPELASGKRMSAFALTEPGAGSDLSAVKTTARKVGDKYLITGEKVFITNSYFGRTVCVVARVEGEKNKACFVVELPAENSENFELVKYGLHPLKRLWNHGLIFKDFPVPLENRITDENTNGMLSAYHGLNFGRIAVLANAAGALRQVLRSITPKAWGEYRRTMGASIQDRELVQVRIAKAAALTVACDALRDWSSTKLDQGYRGELECTIAKVFGSWAQQEGAIEIGLLTHGGRSLRHGNLIGDNLFDFLAALIYEGENHMLLMKYFLELFGEHGERFMLPIANSLEELKKGKVWHLATLGWHGGRFGLWCLGAALRAAFSAPKLPIGMDKRLAAHVRFAFEEAKALALTGTYYMVKHQAGLQKRQSRLVELSKLSLWSVVMLVTAMHAHNSGDEATIDAADVLCQMMAQKLRPQHAPDSFYRDCAKLSRKVVEGAFKQLDGTVESAIVHPYQQ